MLATTERVVKCPTGHCPGWITVDDSRPQTLPCRYCRVTVNTLAYLLDSTADSAEGATESTRVPPRVHEATSTGAPLIAPSSASCRARAVSLSSSTR